MNSTIGHEPFSPRPVSATNGSDAGERLHDIDGGLFAVPGIRGSAVRTGVKPSGSADLALVVGDSTMSCAAMFTTSAVAAPPVTLSRAKLSQAPQARAIIINSGNANALTGPDGDRHAQQMLDATERATGGPAIVLSTGIIGVPLPIDKVLAGVPAAMAALDDDGGGAERAILTTDTSEKTAAVSVLAGGRRFTVGGMAKGSGMIHPRMATTLAVMATDAPLEPGALRSMLQGAIDRSFHAISVDGDTSTNDAAVLLAPEPDEGSGLTPAELAAVAAGVERVARQLARLVVEDGEGMTRLMRLTVTGARTVDDARQVASSIATSSLVKTALAGGDPNFGRILAAAGNAGVDLAPSDLTLDLGGLTVFAHGGPLAVDEAALNEAFSDSEVDVALDLGRGRATASMLTTDLTYRYVEINAEYTT